MTAINPRVKDDWVALWMETTWGQTINAADNMKRLDCEPFEIDIGLKELRPSRSQQSRILELDNVRQDLKGSVPSFSVISAVKAPNSSPASAGNIAEWLYLATQNVAEGATPGFIKTFTILTGQPDFQSNAGIVFAVAKRSIPGDGSRCVLVKDALCKRVRFTCAPDENEGRLTVHADWVGRGPVNRSYANTGTTVEVPQYFFHFMDLKAVTCGGNPVWPSSIELDFQLDIVPYSVDVSTNRFLTYVIKGYKVLATIKALWTQDTYDLLVGNDDDPLVPATWEIKWGTATNLGYLDFALNAIILPSKENETDPREITFNLECVRDGSTVPFTGTVQDNNQRSW